MFLAIRQKVNRLPRWKLALASVAAVLLAVVLPLTFANAIGEATIVSFLGWIANLLIEFFGFFLVRLIGILTFVAQHDVFIHSRAVTIGWVVVRDLMNMFFIVILLVISIGTILRSQTYSYKNLLMKFIIAVILVNFSKTITGIFIDLSNVVMDAFADAIADNVAANLITGMGIEDMVTFANRNVATEISVSSVFVSMVLAVVMMIIADIVVAGLVVILAARIIVLWILAILSPFAFAGSLLPVTQQYASRWWSELGKYLTNGPVLLFFLWLSLTIIGDPAAPPVVLGGSYGSASTTAPTSIAAAASVISSPQRIFDYIIAIGLLVATMKLTQEMGGVGASLAGKVQAWTRKAALAPLKGAANLGIGALGKFDRTVLGKKGLSVQAAIEAWKHNKAYREGRKQKEIHEARNVAREKLAEKFGMEFFSQEDLSEAREKIEEKVRAAQPELEGPELEKEVSRVILGKKKYTGADGTDHDYEGMADDIVNYNETKEKVDQRQIKNLEASKDGQHIKVGFLRLAQMALMNPDDFMENFGGWKNIMPRIFGGNGRLTGALFGFDPAADAQRTHELSVAKDDAKQRKRKMTTTKEIAKRREEIVKRMSEATAISADMADGKINLDHSYGLVEEVMRRANDQIAELGDEISKLKVKEDDEPDDDKKKGFKDDRIGKQAEREKLQGLVKDFGVTQKRYGEADVKVNELTAQREALERTSLDENLDPEKRKEAEKQLVEIDKKIIKAKDERDAVNGNGKGVEISELLTEESLTEFKEAMTEGVKNAEEEATKENAEINEIEKDKSLIFDDDVAKKAAVKAIDAEISRHQDALLQHGLQTAAHKAPSFYYLDAERRSLASAETKKVQTDNWTEIVAVLRDAIRRKDHMAFEGLFRKAAADGNDNEVLDYFGFKTNAEGAREFKEKMLEGVMGMEKQLASSIMNDVEYVNEKINHWAIARGHYVDEYGLYREHTPQDQDDERFAEMSKLNNENFLRSANRLAYGGEDGYYDRRTHRWGREFEFDPHGLAMVAASYKTIVGQMGKGRFNPNAAQKFTQSPYAMQALHEFGRSGFVDRRAFEDFMRELKIFGSSTKAPPADILHYLQRQRI